MIVAFHLKWFYFDCILLLCVYTFTALQKCDDNLFITFELLVISNPKKDHHQFYCNQVLTVESFEHFVFKSNKLALHFKMFGKATYEILSFVCRCGFKQHINFFKWTPFRLFWCFRGSIREINTSHGFCWFCEIIFVVVVVAVNRSLAFALSHVWACVGDFFWLNVEMTWLYFS